MRKNISWLALLLASVLTLSSCLGDNDDTEYTYYSDTAITAFTLGTVKRYLASTTTAGNDTTLSSTVTGSQYAFVIDQATGQIYNNDSLPYGCDMEAVLATISTKNSGYVYLKSLTSDSLSYYSSSDSIDFTAPRTLRVVAQDAQHYRDYTVTVNVHKQLEGKFQWQKLAAFPDTIEASTGMKAAAGDGKLFLLRSEDGTTSVYAYANGTWSFCTPNINTPLAADAYKSALVWDGNLYILNNGMVLRTANGSEWEQRGTDASLKQLVAASDTELYALTENGLAASTDGGNTWTAETLADPATLLPAEGNGYSCQAVKTNEQIDRVTFVGTSAGDTNATTWTRLADYGDNPVGTAWSYVDVAGDTAQALHNMTGLTVLPYNSGLLAFGYENGAMATPLVSIDNGIVWRANSTYALPDSVETGGKFAVTVDADNYLWLVTDKGQVWRGRLNELGWEK